MAGTQGGLELTQDERVLRGLLQFFLCADARRPSEEVPLRLKYRDLILTAFPSAVSQSRAAGLETQEPTLVGASDEEHAEATEPTGGLLLDVEDSHHDEGGSGMRASLQAPVDVEDVADAEGVVTPIPPVLNVEEGPDDVTRVAEVVAEAVNATEAAEAAEAEVEAIMREDALRQALLDPEGEARRRRIQARKLQGRRWNFAGRRGRAGDRFREHEVDLESRRKLAYRARGRFRGPAEDQGDERQQSSLARHREASKMGTLASGSKASRASKTQEARGKSTAKEKRAASSSHQAARKHRRKDKTQPTRLRLPPINFPELPILIADQDEEEVLPAMSRSRRARPVVLQAERQFREARRKELEIMRDHFTEELQAVQTERQEAAKELRQSCVAEAEAVEKLQEALTAAFGTVID
ncbi:unnamed protein product [Effrenium voratum]|uniref:Uncharacterized protein n=1 Tax=Effrenium voratum TaxID=2562239 RepID=A0AA36MW09_9DINO|nr:unnamed protein product [Effrenium voratum]CAJ1388288.1 unnamed protein product [Effrenium voratum]